MYSKGGFKRGFNFWHNMLATYTQPRDVVLQLLLDGPMLPTIGKVTGRHILQAAEDVEFLECIRVRHDQKANIIKDLLSHI